MEKVFNLYALYYNLLYKDKAYKAESEYVHSLVQYFAPGVTSILELGSGTGAHAEHLAHYGYSVHGIDLSATMVKQAEIRKEGLPPEISRSIFFEVGDIRSVRTGRKYDVIISLFHVMSYQTSNQDLKQAFETASTHLNPGGIFIFDYWFGPAVLTLKPEVKLKRMEDDNNSILRIAEPSLDPISNTVEVNFTIQITDKNSVEKAGEVKESHLMRYLFLPELELYSDNFELVETKAWMSPDSPTVDDWVAISIMKKK